MTIAAAIETLEKAGNAADKAARLGHLYTAKQLVSDVIKDAQKALVGAAGVAEHVDEVGTPPFPGMDVTVDGEGVVQTPADTAERTRVSDRLPDESELEREEAAF